MVFALVMALGVVDGATAAVKAYVEKECGGCHDLSGPGVTTVAGVRARKGPDLFYAGNKYRQEWMAQWLQAPYRIRPAGMYYGRHIRSTPDGDVIDEATLNPHMVLDRTQAEKVAAYLMTLKAKSGLIEPGAYKPGKISLSMGELMFDKFRGCLACHQIEPGYGGLSGPEVYTVANRLQADYLVSFMRRPMAWDPRTFMPDKHLKETDVQKFVHYFRALAAEELQK
jgi:mono/diheme cytochrome c family protein